MSQRKLGVQEWANPFTLALSSNGWHRSFLFYCGVGTLVCSKFEIDEKINFILIHGPPELDDYVRVSQKVETEQPISHYATII